MGRKLTITHVSLEEDSCREVKDKGHRIVWRTDRLGMPLTETVTGPELVAPEEVREAIVLCGLVARNTGRVRTGIGASRQDVNVSVRGGQRVEIKGVPKAGYAVKLVHNEAVRQVNLLRFRDELHRRGMRVPEDILLATFDVTDVFADADLGFMRRAMQGGGKIFAARLHGGLGLAQMPTQPDTMFLDELSGRIRVIACLDEPPIVLSGALMPEFPDKHKFIERLRKRIRLGDSDDYFIVFGPEADCRTAVEEIRIRFVDAIKGIPQETRQALTGGYTTFERILPGPDRMYPDTDSPPTRITPERVAEARSRLRPPPWQRIAKYGALRVPRETTEFLIRRGGARSSMPWSSGPASMDWWPPSKSVSGQRPWSGPASPWIASTWPIGCRCSICSPAAESRARRFSRSPLTLPKIPAWMPPPPARRSATPSRIARRGRRN